MDSIDPARISTIRSLILSAIRRCGPTDAMLLSGGLDTCILAQAWPTADPNTQPSLAVTVLAAPEATDAPYAKAIAQSMGMQHKCITMDSPLDLARDQDLLDFVVGVLGSFDPMEIRNSLAIAKALLECKARGVKTVVTGDGADELFAGYSFVRSMSEEDLHKYTRHLTTIWRFAAVPLGRWRCWTWPCHHRSQLIDSSPPRRARSSPRNQGGPTFS
ncbi:hypothetical protein BCR44DRAFT_1454290 [Catenaria anguillulae PL171]|uniref:Asparagine synthetase domain-containing protein n=1 Tax=Catenaria anguillulae PL171 TaxID=765915 RepID=A0A1Y2H822_9FUNG|nr:hypothetical protein BCR44DRAFT_1454290 [Catenaria anguillulae PL171]